MTSLHQCKPFQISLLFYSFFIVKASLVCSLILTFLDLSLMLPQKVFHNKMYRERQVLIEATTETMASTEVLWLGFNVKAEGKTSSSRDATKFPVYAIQLNMLLMVHSRYIRTLSSQHLLSTWLNCTEVHFASFLSVGFITAMVVKPLERKLAKRTSVNLFRLVYGLLGQSNMHCTLNFCHKQSRRNHM